MHINNFNNIRFKNNQQNQNTKLSIGYINDFHGQIPKMEKVITPMQKYDVRLTGGDIFLGHNYTRNKGIAKFMELANIDLSAIGNHDVDMTQKELYDLTKNSKIKYMSANYRKIEGKGTQNSNKAPINEILNKSCIKEINGEKYGFIGASPIDIDIRRIDPEKYNDCKIDDPIETLNSIQKEADNLKKQGINKIILLSHLGYKLDKEVAKNTSGIDIIIGGHSHDLVKNVTKGENLFNSKINEPVVITNAGKDGQYFGNLNVEFDEKGILKSVQNNVYSTDNYSKNLIYQKIIEDELGGNEIIGYIKSAPPEPKDRLAEENPHANFVADTMKKEYNTEIALLDNSCMRSAFQKGTITKLDTDMISPFGNKTVIADVTEKDLVDALKVASKSVVNVRPGLIVPSGFRYSVRKADGELMSLTMVDKNGKETPVDINNPSTTKTYRAAGDSFLMSGRDGMVSLNYMDKAEKIYDVDKEKAIYDYIKNSKEPIEIDNKKRITLV